MNSSRGFSLIEMIVVVTIIGLLAAVAFPAYREQIAKSRRTALKSQLQEIQQNMERYYTLNNTYVGFSLGALDVSPPGATSTKVFYTIRFSAGPTVSGYTLAAQPSNGHSTDRCGTFTLSQNGQRTPTTPVDCW